MGEIRSVFDTNILVDFLNGIDAANDELHRFRDRAIGIVTWAEVLVGATDERENDTRNFLRSFTVIDVNLPIADRAVALRRARRLKLPDALIWATAETQGALLVIRNIKDFPADATGIRVPYSA